ncbi:MAG: SDR family oxidoreductase [Deltaproteobacteria bacterium]|nr:SDR family oxidoreductase [Deltaproteobacteria bacterium]
MENDNAHTQEAARPAALVTGGAVRVGAAIASLLVESGYDVAIHCNTSTAAAEGLAASLAAHGARTPVLQADLTRPGAPFSLVTRAVEAFGRLDVVVNSAAVFVADDAAMIDLARMKVLNVDAPRAVLDAAAPHVAPWAGCVVNISDVAALFPFRGYKSYARTKAALLSLSQERALALAPHNVRVNAVCPGVAVFADRYTNKERARIVSRIPLGRAGSPLDVAGAVLYLARAPYVTGQILVVDGGRTLRSMQEAGTRAATGRSRFDVN